MSPIQILNVYRLTYPQVHIYFLPFYFQAVKGTTAEGSGIRTIPYLGSIILSSIAVGAGITYIGWYKPFMVRLIICYFFLNILGPSSRILSSELSQDRASSVPQMFIDNTY
jgi:hypothetical protein